MYINAWHVLEVHQFQDTYYDYNIHNIDVVTYIVGDSYQEANNSDIGSLLFQAFMHMNILTFSIVMCEL